MKLWKVENELENTRTQAIMRTMVNIWAAGGGDDDDRTVNSDPTLYDKPLSGYSDEEMDAIMRPKEMGRARVVDGQQIDFFGEQHIKRRAEERARGQLKLDQKPFEQMARGDQMKFSSLVQKLELEEERIYLATPAHERTDIMRMGSVRARDREATRRYEEAKKMPGHELRDEVTGEVRHVSEPSPRVIGGLEYDS